ncbi:hypothetical protein electrica_02456 [Klebsiella electrica]|uniref:ATP-grasp fold amidoligase family protein n=1 Tax=Klebsiella electrica TaxID=1259973 RepID=UPI001154C930|nr:ATP-grasp fold amidoligase family protein [Klebsiella electrica]QDI08576.1 hypothetical protein electrica_02456 [Klebsiella electrica]
MNKFNALLKYSEYQIKKLRSYIISDRRFHAGRLQRIYGSRPDLKHPVTLNEKICHRMIYDHNPLYTLLADKLAVREYIDARSQHIKTVPLLGIYRNVNEIDFSQLPDKFVLKCNHDSGSTIICLDKYTFNVPRALRQLNSALKKNMYYRTREWQYKHIPPVILCESYIDLFSHGKREITPEMLRLHCFHGSVGFIEADFMDADGKEYINVFDRYWQLLPFQMEYPSTPYEVPEPQALHQAIASAQELANDIDYCRVDLMLLRDTIYFSEITLSPRRGKLIINPAQWDTILGEMWRLPRANTELS